LRSAPWPARRETAQAARSYLKQLRAGGGTNIYAALQTALAPAPSPGTLPIVLFLTDGLPTAGNTSEVAIREVATKQNPGERRIFTFGVGADVNTPLLQKIATETRGTASFVLPGENVEAAVAAVFSDLQGPVLTSADLHVKDNAVAAAGGAAPLPRVTGMLPATLPDLYDGDQLVVLGRYAGKQPLEFRLIGDYHGAPRTFTFRFALDRATTANAYVPRLWASRRIAHLVDEIRQMGADPAVAVSSSTTGGTDPKVKELVDEIVGLSTEFGILTEYTAFLAREGTDLSDTEGNTEVAEGNLRERAMKVRSGLAAVNQGFNMKQQQAQVQMNYDNSYMNEKMERVQIMNVQQVSDRAFYRRGERWIDSRVAQSAKALEPDEVIEIGSDAFRALVQRLADNNRAGVLALDGEILLQVDGQVLLIRRPVEN
jgi:Ca-activated chloride channel family protein